MSTKPVIHSTIEEIREWSDRKLEIMYQQVVQQRQEFGENTLLAEYYIRVETVYNERFGTVN